MNREAIPRMFGVLAATTVLIFYSIDRSEAQGAGAVGSAVGGIGSAVGGVGSAIGGVGSAVGDLGGAVGGVGSAVGGVGSAVGGIGGVGGVGGVGGAGAGTDSAAGGNASAGSEGPSGSAGVNSAHEGQPIFGAINSNAAWYNEPSPRWVCPRNYSLRTGKNGVAICLRGRH